MIMKKFDNINDPYIQLLSIKFWFKFITRRFGYLIPPSNLKNFFLRISGINIGKQVFIGDKVIFIDGYQENKIVLKDRSVLSPGATLIATSYPYKSQLRFKTNFLKDGIILIQEDSWIGANSIIYSNIKIGPSSILGAGSILTKSIGENEVWVGNPAKFLKSIS